MANGIWTRWRQRRNPPIVQSHCPWCEVIAARDAQSVQILRRYLDRQIQEGGPISPRRKWWQRILRTSEEDK